MSIKVLFMDKKHMISLSQDYKCQTPVIEILFAAGYLQVHYKVTPKSLWYLQI